MKFYIAATFQRQREMQKRAEELGALGHRVTSSWIQSAEQNPENVEASAEAIKDLLDVDAADALILFADVPSSTGGYHVEYGYALGKKPVIVIGGPKNIFQSLPIAKQYKTWQDFLDQLREDRMAKIQSTFGIHEDDIMWQEVQWGPGGSTSHAVWTQGDGGDAR